MDNTLNRAFGAALVNVLLTVACAAAQQSTTAEELHRTHKEALSQGDIATAVATLAADVVYVAGSNCTVAKPCTGRDQVRDGFLTWAKSVNMKVTPISSQSVGDDRTRVKVAVTWDGIDKYGIQRVIGYDDVRMRDGLISELRYSPDPTDAQTAAFLNARATASAPKGD